MKKQTIRCDKCNKLVKDLWEVTISNSNFYVWELHFCSKECCENHKFSLQIRDEDFK